MSRTIDEDLTRSSRLRSESAIARKKRRVMLLRRLRLARTVMMFVIFSMIAALINLQVFTSTDAYPGIGEAAARTVPVPAVRGAISDRWGKPLATTIEVRNVFADQMMVTDPAGQAKKLAPLLRMDSRELRSLLTGNRRFVYLKREVSQSLWMRIADLHLPGIGSERAQQRSYPEGLLTSNLLGRLDYEGTATDGLEKQYDSILAGKDGRRSIYGAVVQTGDGSGYAPAVDGSHLTLTIDKNIQGSAQQAIAAKVKESGAESGTVIVMNAKTGEILAMATAPTFDPLNITKETQKYMSNRAVTEYYEPGSTGKVMTMAAILDSGLATPTTKFKVPYELKRADGILHDHKQHPTLRLTLAGILAKSSNTGTILAAESMSDQTLYNYFTKFGVGQPSGLNFPYESRGKLLPAKEWGGTDRYNKMFGQGYTVTPLQAASIFATIANGGVRMAPRLVAGVTDPSGTFTPAEPSTPQRVVSEQAAEQVRLMMESVVSDEGTAPMAQIPGYRVAGKTGTAQVWNNELNDWKGYVASFIGFAPADNPELVVAVNLVKPKNGHFGGVLAGPVFKKVMTFALAQLRLPSTDKKSPKMQLTW